VIGQHERLRLVVRDVDERRAEIRLQLLQLDLHVLAQLEVERAQRLVEQQQRGLEHEAPRDRHPLLLAARQLVDALALRAGKADPLQHRLDARRDLRARDAAPRRGRSPRCRRRSSSGKSARCWNTMLTGRRFGGTSRIERPPMRMSPRQARESPRSCAAASSCRSRTARGSRRSCRARRERKRVDRLCAP
jgi:hypothetical protein